MLSLILFLPALGAVFLSLLPRNNNFLIYITVFFQISCLALGLYATSFFNFQNSDYQFIEKINWIDLLGASYHLGLDGMSLIFILLVLAIFPLACMGFWQGHLNKNKWILFNILLLETGLLGVFLAVDTLLFYFFWELVLIPMYFIIVLWGSSAKAALQFFIYTMAASFLMLLAILIMAIIARVQLGYLSFDILVLKQVNLGQLQSLFFWAFVIAFAVKIPLVPFHGWMPAAYKNAPWIGTIFMSTLLSKMGIYGLLRFALPLFPQAAKDYAFVLLILAVISILYTACIATIQKDFKMIISYSSVSHLGFIVLGIFSFQSIALNGAVLQIINHSIVTFALFLLLSFFAGLNNSNPNFLQLSAFSGLAKITPKFCVLFFIFSLAAIGLPSTGSFIGEFFILVGSFKEVTYFAILASLGMILAAVYMLRANRILFFGANPSTTEIQDLTYGKLLVILPSLVFVFWIGLYPSFFFRLFESSISKILINLGG